MMEDKRGQRGHYIANEAREKQNRPASKTIPLKLRKNKIALFPARQQVQ